MNRIKERQRGGKCEGNGDFVWINVRENEHGDSITKHGNTGRARLPKHLKRKEKRREGRGGGRENVYLGERPHHHKKRIGECGTRNWEREKMYQGNVKTPKKEEGVV